MEESESDNDKQNEESTADAPQGNDDEEPTDLDATPRIRLKRILSPTSLQSFKGSDPHTARHRYDPHQAHYDADIASLTQSLNSLSLGPNSVRFGGGKARGFASDKSPWRYSWDRKRQSCYASNGCGRYSRYEYALPPPFRGRGIPFRGRGRGRGRSNLALN